MESITIYGVGKYRDDIMTINIEEAALLIIELTIALKDKYKNHANIAIPTVTQNHENPLQTHGN